jgi:hypothetical protein
VFAAAGKKTQQCASLERMQYEAQPAPFLNTQLASTNFPVRFRFINRERVSIERSPRLNFCFISINHHFHFHLKTLVYFTNLINKLHISVLVGFEGKTFAASIRPITYSKRSVTSKSTRDVGQVLLRSLPVRLPDDRNHLGRIGPPSIGLGRRHPPAEMRIVSL